MAAAAGHVQNAHPDLSEDESSDALPLIEMLLRRHEEMTSTGSGAPDGIPGPSAAFTAHNSLHSHFFEHCGMAARSGVGALISSLLHLCIPGDYTFLTAVVASVCLAPTVGSTLAKSMHSVYVVLLLPPLTLAALLLSSPAPLSAFGYTASVALALLSFLVVLSSPPPTTRKLSIALSVVGVFRSCQLVLASPLRPDATTAFAATDWAAVILLISRIMFATAAGIGAQAAAVLPLPRTARTQMDIELRAAAAGVALHAEAVAAAMSGEVDPLSDEWGIETHRWREAVAEALAAAAEHSSALQYEAFLRYNWDAADRRRQLGAIQGMARLLCKLGDAQLQLRAATDRGGQHGSQGGSQGGGRRRAGRQEGGEVLQAMAPELRALCACARGFAMRAGSGGGGGAGAAGLATEIDEVMDRLDASFLEARMVHIYLPRYATACQMQRLDCDGTGGGQRADNGGEPTPAAPPSAVLGASAPSAGVSLAVFSGTAHQALIIAESMIFLWTQFGKTLRDASSLPDMPTRAQHGCGACLGGGDASRGCSRSVSAARALYRALMRRQPPPPPPCHAAAGEEERDEWEVAVDVEAARLGCALPGRDCGRDGEGRARGEGGARRAGEERPAPAGGSGGRYKKVKGAARLSVALLAALLVTWPETRGVWAGITVAMVMELGPGASFRASLYRLQGSVIGAFYALAAIYAAARLDIAVYGAPTPAAEIATTPAADPATPADAEPPWADGRDVLRLGVLIFLFVSFAAGCGFVRASLPRASYAALVAHFTAAIVLMGPRCGGLGARCAASDLGAEDFSFDRIQYTLVGLAIVTLASLIVFPVDSRGSARHALADGAAGLRLLWAQSHEHWLTLSRAPGGQPGRGAAGKADGGMARVHAGVELVCGARTVDCSLTRTAAEANAAAPAAGSTSPPADPTATPASDPARRLERALSHACAEARSAGHGRALTHGRPSARPASAIAPQVSALSALITRRLDALPQMIEEAEAAPACWRPPYAGHPATAVLRAMKGLLDALGTLQLSNEAVGPGEALALLRPMQRPLDRLELMVARGLRRLEQKLRLSGARAVRGLGDSPGGGGAGTRRREPLYASVQSTLQLLEDCYGAVITSLAVRAFRERARAEQDSFLAMDGQSPSRARAAAAAALAAAAPPTPNRDVLCFNARVYAVRLLAQRMLQLDSAIDEMHVHEEPFDLRSVIFA